MSGRNLRGSRGGVQRHRIGPDSTQPLAHVRRAQVFQGDAVASPVGKRRVDLALSRKIGPQLDRAPDVDGDQERRPFVQRLGVVFGLAFGDTHDAVQRLLRRRARPGGRLRKERQLGGGIQRSPVSAFARLLGLENEAATLGAIDPARRGQSVVVKELDRALETVVQIAGALIVRGWRADQAAKLDDEGLIVRALADGGGGPVRDEGVHIVRLFCEHTDNLWLSSRTAQPKRDFP